MGTKLSKKARTAVEMMKAGAYWRKALETGWRGREMFETRLRFAGTGVVRGFGFKTWAELEAASLLTTRECAKSSTWPTEWVLR